MKPRRYVVTGIPRSGKNSGRIMKRGARRFVTKSKAAEAWLGDALGQLTAQRGRVRPLRVPVHVHLAIYQPHEKPDGDNVQNLVWDALVHAAIVEDDSLIATWSGEKHVADGSPPRVEIEVRPV